MKPLIIYLAQLDFNISIEGSVWLLILLALFALIFSYFIYNETTPPTSRTLRNILFILRFCALLGFITLIFHPIINIQDTFIQKPDLAILIDKSKSLQIEDDNEKRAISVQKLLEASNWENLESKFNLHFYPFSTGIDTNFSYKSADSLKFDGEGTDISRALDLGKKQLLNGHYTSAILISDGNYNTGENPEFFVQRYGIPVHTIGIGDPSIKKDIILQRVATNDIVYTNNRVPIDITVKHEGFEGNRIDLLLKEGDEVIDRKLVRLGSDGQEQVHRLHFTPQKPGFHEYKIEIPALQDEFTSQNNFRSLFVKVLESKIKVLLIAGEPSLDLKFIQKALNNDENIELFTIIQKKGGGYYTKAKVNSILREDFNLLVFLGFPRWPIQIDLLNFLKENLIRKKKPLYFIEAPNLHIAALSQFNEVLPFQISATPKSVKEVVVDPTIAGENTALILISDNRSANQTMWNNLPPIFTFLNNFKKKPDSEVLLTIEPSMSKLPETAASRKPILLTRQFDGQKSLALLGYGFWRWDLLMWGVGKTNEMLVRFLQRSIRWLVTREEVKQVKISTDKLVYRSGEQVYVLGQVYTQDYQPVDNALVKLQVKHQDEEKEYILEPMGNGKYEIQFRIFQGGDYDFSAEANREDQFFGADSGKFSVGAFEIEFQQTQMNEALLKRVANISGGSYYTIANFGELAENLNAEGRARTINREINLWNLWWSLFIPLLFLAIEWTIRRRRGML